MRLALHMPVETIAKLDLFLRAEAPVSLSRV
jgi:hypothetical protein